MFGGGGSRPEVQLLKVLGDIDFFVFHLHELCFSYK